LRICIIAIIVLKGVSTLNVTLKNLLLLLLLKMKGMLKAMQIWNTS